MPLERYYKLGRSRVGLLTRVCQYAAFLGHENYPRSYTLTPCNIQLRKGKTQ